MNACRDRELRNVLLISLDCVRPEALSCYSRQFPLRVRVPIGDDTPNIDYLACHGHRFRQAVTPAPYTPAAHASLLTGLIPPDHGIRMILGSKLNDGVVTIAEYLSSNGWTCGAVVGSGSLSHEFGLCRGFDFYDDYVVTGQVNWLLGERRDAVDVTDRAIGWVKSLSGDRFFLFVHYFDAHHLAGADGDTGQVGRVLSVNRAPRLRQLLRPIYAATIDHFEISLPFTKYGGYGRRYMLSQVRKIDTQIGRLLKALSDLGTLGETLVVVVSDHGDDFWEHGEPDHRRFLYDTTLRVPLVIYPEIGNNSIIEEQTSLIDIFPSIISFLGMDPRSTDTQGLSFEGLLKDDPDQRRMFLSRPAYSETVFESHSSETVQLVTAYAALRLPPWKLIWDRLDNSYELYNLDEDAGELRNSCRTYPDITNDLFRKLECLAQRTPLITEDETNELVIHRLKGLGYL